MKYAVLLLFFSTLAQRCFAQQEPAVKTGTDAVIRLKNYALLTRFQQVKQVCTLLENDAELKTLAERHRRALQNAVVSCTDVNCFTDAMKFTDKEITAVGERLTRLYDKEKPLQQLTETLFSSGKYSLIKTDGKKQFFAKAWEQDAHGINHVLDVYLGGKMPNYPKIDSIAFNIRDRAYLNMLYDFAVVAADESKGKNLFFEPSLNCALHALEINERSDAANNEPMENGENKAVIAAVKKTDWKNYPYTVIMVPGAGPEEPAVALSAEGMLRCRLAALRYREKLAPFVMVSGGKVHPYKTPFIEAVEMKKYMVKTLHVPADAIIIEPHARHTTTNMRNAARLIFRYKIPVDKPAVVSTTKLQSDAIQKMEGRCLKELGYVPYKLGKLVNGNVLEFYPQNSAMQIDWDEPLDP